MKTIRVALAIQKSTPGNVAENLDTCLTLTRTAAQNGATIILFPELNLTGYTLGKRLIPITSTVPGILTNALLKSSADNKITILAGLAQEDIQGVVFCTHVAAMADKTLGVYQKLHIPPPERKIFTPGSAVTTFPTEYAHFGIQLCYDAHFPELSTRMALKGAEILFSPMLLPGELLRRNSPPGFAISRQGHLTTRFLCLRAIRWAPTKMVATFPALPLPLVRMDILFPTF